MVTIGMNYRVRAGKEEVFERAFQAVLETLKKGEGHVNSWLYQDTSASGSYLILSEWNNEELFKAFISSDAFAKVTNWGQQEILAERPKHHVYTSSPLTRPTH